MLWSVTLTAFALSKIPLQLFYFIFSSSFGFVFGTFMHNFHLWHIQITGQNYYSESEEFHFPRLSLKILQLLTWRHGPHHQHQRRPYMRVWIQGLDTTSQNSGCGGYCIFCYRAALPSETARIREEACVSEPWFAIVLHCSRYKHREADMPKSIDVRICMHILTYLPYCFAEVCSQDTSAEPACTLVYIYIYVHGSVGLQYSRSARCSSEMGGQWVRIL